MVVVTTFSLNAHSVIGFCHILKKTILKFQCCIAEKCLNFNRWYLVKLVIATDTSDK